MAKVTMPQLGESVAEGTIGKWLKQPGDHVAKFEPLLEVITDKVNAEVPSPVEGTLTEILVEEGATVPNNAEIAIILEAGEAASGAPAPSAAAPVLSASVEEAPAVESIAPAPRATPPPPAAMAPTQAPAVPAPAASAAAMSAAQPSVAAPRGNPDARMTPAVRRLMREHGLSPEQIVGTGGGGRITREDVHDFVESQRTGQPVGRQAPATPAAPPATAPASVASPAVVPPAPSVSVAPVAPAAQPSAVPEPGPTVAFPAGQDEVLVPWTQMRRGVATAMLRSKTTVPHAYTTVEVDATNLVRLRDARKAEYQAREGLSLSYVPFIVKAVVEGLRRHPRLNALWTEEGLLVKRSINVALAVAIEDGLITPVVHDADQLSIHGLNRAVQELAARARGNRLRLDDLQGGTITVNNTGWFGSIASQSIVNTPQVVIVNMEAIVKRPVVLETGDGDVIAVRSMMNLPAAFDHRATDGAQVGRFVADIKAAIEAYGPDTPIY